MMVMILAISAIVVASLACCPPAPNREFEAPTDGTYEFRDGFGFHVGDEPRLEVEGSVLRLFYTGPDGERFVVTYRQAES